MVISTEKNPTEAILTVGENLENIFQANRNTYILPGKLSDKDIPVWLAAPLDSFVQMRYGPQIKEPWANIVIFKMTQRLAGAIVDTSLKLPTGLRSLETPIPDAPAWSATLEKTHGFGMPTGMEPFLAKTTPEMVEEVREAGVVSIGRTDFCTLPLKAVHFPDAASLGLISNGGYGDVQISASFPQTAEDGTKCNVMVMAVFSARLMQRETKESFEKGESVVHRNMRRFFPEELPLLDYERWKKEQGGHYEALR